VNQRRAETARRRLGTGHVIEPASRSVVDRQTDTAARIAHGVSAEFARVQTTLASKPLRRHAMKSPTFLNGREGRTNPAPIPDCPSSCPVTQRTAERSREVDRMPA